MIPCTSERGPDRDRLARRSCGILPQALSWTSGQTKLAQKRLPSSAFPWVRQQVHVLAETPDKLQQGCRSMVSSSAEYGIPFGDSSLEMLGDSIGAPVITLVDGRKVIAKPCIKVFRVTAGRKCRHGGQGKGGQGKGRHGRVVPQPTRLWLAGFIASTLRQGRTSCGMPVA